MEIIVVSGSHGRDGALEYALQQHGDACVYIHCGDIDMDSGTFPRFMMVGGNNDILYDYPDERILSIGTHHISIVHSRQFVYSRRSQQLADAVKKYSCDTVCYGHTYIAADKTADDICLVNSESLWRSRDGGSLSYALLNIGGDTVDIQFEPLPQRQKKSKFFWQDKPYMMRFFLHYRGFKSQG